MTVSFIIIFVSIVLDLDSYDHAHNEMTDVQGELLYKATFPALPHHLHRYREHSAATVYVYRLERVAGLIDGSL